MKSQDPTDLYDQILKEWETKTLIDSETGWNYVSPHEALRIKLYGQPSENVMLLKQKCKELSNQILADDVEDKDEMMSLYNNFFTVLKELYQEKEYDLCFSECNKMLQMTNKSYPYSSNWFEVGLDEEDANELKSNVNFRARLEYIRGQCSTHLRGYLNRYSPYLVNKALTEAVGVNCESEEKCESNENTESSVTITHSVVVTMTTCKRFLLFCETMNALLYCLSDELDMIRGWLIVDDLTCEMERAMMKVLYPFATFVMKDQLSKGHPKSMDIIAHHPLVVSSTYILHLEDDWLFFEKKPYIRAMIKILEVEKNKNSYDNPDLQVVQVLINRNDAKHANETHLNLVGCRRLGIVETPIVSDDLTTTADVTPYASRIFISHTTPEYGQFFANHPGCSGSVYWPHYSLRPSLLRSDILRICGPFFRPNQGFFERLFADTYYEKGFRSVYLDGVYFFDIGDEQNNAYKINNENQFA